MLRNQGHSVRFACQKEHRKLIEGSGHDYYPLAGDIKAMTKTMIESSKSFKQEMKINSERLAISQEIIRSTWDAATQPSPNDPDQRPFEADAIISNPITMGHIHVAEALSIPLHLYFPQTWSYGTKEIPHPMSKLPYNKEGNESLNFQSYNNYEGILWVMMSSFFNQWRRKVLSLPALSLGSGVSSLIPDSSVPFTAMWSPAFIPKPQE